MKKIFNFATLALFALTTLLSGCQDPLERARENAPVPEIRSISIVNGGLAGTERYAGKVNQEEKTIVFEDVASESDFTAVKFEASMSIGAELTQATYDFLTGQESETKQLTQTIGVTNPDLLKEQAYEVVIRLKAPETAPVIDNIVLKNDAGEEHTVTMTNVFESMLLLGMGESETAEVVSVTLKPARATYTFSALADNKLSKSNPGTLTLNFMGLETTYELSWASSPTPGADFTKAVVHDFTVNTSIYLDWADENTRGGDMDENYILVVNRTGATEPNPYLLMVDDVLNDNTSNKMPLNIEGIEGGTFYISAGRLTQGHVFCCNLPALGVNVEGENDGPLKVYHWATPSSKPEVVMAWDGTGIVNAEGDEAEYHARIGDNISLSLDEGGNGYAFFSQQEGAGLVFRFTVRNFTEWSEPFKIQLPAVANYYGMYNKCGDNEYVCKSVFNATLWLLDAEGTKLGSVAFDGGKDGGNATDYRIVNFNRARYLLGTNARRYAWYAPEALCLYDITEGMTNAEALKNMELSKPVDPESEDPTMPNYLPYVPTYQYVFDSGTISAACVAITGVAEKNGKLLILTAAPHAGMAVIELPKAE